MVVRSANTFAFYIFMIALLSFPGAAPAQDTIEVLGNPLDTDLISFKNVRQPFTNEPDVLSKGINLRCSEGQPVYAAHRGRIAGSFYNFCAPDSDPLCGTGLGNQVCVSFLKTIQGENRPGNLTTCYANLSGTQWPLGVLVKKGFLLGYCGHTGAAPESQLHFRCYLNGNHVNPENCIGKDIEVLVNNSLPYPKESYLPTTRME